MKKIMLILILLIPSVYAFQGCNDDFCIIADDSLGNQQLNNDNYSIVTSPQIESVFQGSNEQYTLIVSSGFDDLISSPSTPPPSGGGGGGGSGITEEEPKVQVIKCYTILTICWYWWGIIISLLILFSLITIRYKKGDKIYILNKIKNIRSDYFDLE